MHYDETDCQELAVGMSGRAGPSALGKPKHLHRCGLRITVEDRVDMLHNIGAHIKEVALVLNRDERALGAVIPGHLERFGEGSQRLNISLDAHVAEHEKCWTDGSPSHR